MPTNPNDSDKYVDVNQIMYPSTDDFVYGATAQYNPPNAPQMYNQNSSSQNAQYSNYSQSNAPPSYDQMYNNANVSQYPPPLHHNPPPPPMFMQPPPPQQQQMYGAPQWQHGAVPPQGMHFHSSMPPPNPAYVNQVPYTAPPPQVAIMKQPQQRLSPEEEAKRKYTRERLALADKKMRARMSVGSALLLLCGFTVIIVVIWALWLLIAALLTKEAWWHIVLTHLFHTLRLLTFVAVLATGMVALLARNATVNHIFSHLYCGSVGTMICCCYGTLALGAVVSSIAGGPFLAVWIIIGACCVGCICLPICFGYGASGIHKIFVSKQVYEFEKFHEEDRQTNPTHRSERNNTEGNNSA